MLKVNIDQIINALDDAGAFGIKKGSNYQIVVSNKELAVINWKTTETAYLGKTLESAIKLKNLLFQVEAYQQAEAVDNALEDLITETGVWQ